MVLCSPLSRLALTGSLLALSVLIFAACGGRAIGTEGTGGQIPQSDYEGVCLDVTDQVKIQTLAEPSFVYSLDRTGGDRYVVGCSQGWNEQSAQLLLIDGNSLARQGAVEVDAETVRARFDQWSGDVIALAETQSEVWYLRYEVIAAQHLELVDERLLCEQCQAAWGGPETVEAYVGAAVRDLSDEWVRVFVMGRTEAAEVFESESVEGTSPQLVAVGASLSLLYVRDQKLWDSALDSDGVLAPPIERTSSPIEALLGASSYSDDIVGAAVLTASASDPRLEMIVWSGEWGWGSTSVSMPANMDHPVEGTVTLSHGIVGFVWGQTQGDVGTFIAGGEPSPYQSVFGPYRVSDPVNQSPSEHSIWPATSYHDYGYAVVWGGWDEDTGYGIYGKIVSCNVNF
jgi:hypothetical protein